MTGVLQAWYRAWLCLEEWPIYSGSGALVPPCPAHCGKVEMSCPFLTIHEDASMASGDPTFLCQGEKLIRAMNDSLK